MRQKTELLLSEAHEINLYACLDVISFRHVSLSCELYSLSWSCFHVGSAQLCMVNGVSLYMCCGSCMVSTEYST